MVRNRNHVLAASIISGVVLTGFLVETSAIAAPLATHAYTQHKFNNGTALYGGYFSSTNGQEDLYSNWTIQPGSFITKEMWFAFSDSEWIEVGNVKGDMNGVYWNGHFQALRRWNVQTGRYEYTESTIGSSGATGVHNFRVQSGGTNVWNVYVDFNKVDWWTFPIASAKYIQVGIETNDSSNYFTSGTYASSIQYKNSSGTWSNWTTSTNGDYLNNLGWKSTFTYSASTGNKLTFTR